MSRVPVTDEVVRQLRAVIDSGEVEDPVDWMAVQGVALRAGYEALVEFVVAADAVTYYEALERARDAEGAPGNGDDGHPDYPDGPTPN